MPPVEPPYTPAKRQPAYQAALSGLEQHRQARVAAAAAKGDWDDADRWQVARVMPALLVGDPGSLPATVPGLLLELLWDDQSVTARIVAATPDGDLLAEDVVLLRRDGPGYVAFAPVVYAR
ncbi:hypothetical protein [Deinococcus multiflagellatus]|uniref:Uncharacterized protein n=1 Tax=Deinococcus multiflagellatus TaxID=1656887 RepID=A0ABW1ZNX7_9DEIO|nr:hypothetical protein [Deinococcus multiflagellatus]MBZ9715774.1 hypothetical protein [Deinococcus multiflagellatus]